MPIMFLWALAFVGNIDILVGNGHLVECYRGAVLTNTKKYFNFDLNLKVRLEQLSIELGRKK